MARFTGSVLARCNDKSGAFPERIPLISEAFVSSRRMFIPVSGVKLSSISEFSTIAWSLPQFTHILRSVLPDFLFSPYSEVKDTANLSTPNLSFLKNPGIFGFSPLSDG